MKPAREQRRTALIDVIAKTDRCVRAQEGECGRVPTPECRDAGVAVRTRQKWLGRANCGMQGASPFRDCSFKISCFMYTMAQQL